VLVLNHRADRGEPAEVGRVFLRGGRVVRARIADRPAPKNHQAVYAMLTWAEGSFEFSARDVDMEDEVKASTTALLMEGARRIDEAQGRAAAGTSSPPLGTTRPLRAVGPGKPAKPTK
jgi:hypothetical protein